VTVDRKGEQNKLSFEVRLVPQEEQEIAPEKSLT
jgi:hypothetical protein